MRREPHMPVQEHEVTLQRAYTDAVSTHAASYAVLLLACTRLSDTVNYNFAGRSQGVQGAWTNKAVADVAADVVAVLCDHQRGLVYPAWRQGINSIAVSGQYPTLHDPVSADIIEAIGHLTGAGASKSTPDEYRLAVLAVCERMVALYAQCAPDRQTLLDSSPDGWQWATSDREGKPTFG